MIRRRCSDKKRKYRVGVIAFAIILAVGLSGCGNPEVKSALREAELALERAQASSQRNPQQQVQETQQTQESSQKQEDSEEAGTGAEGKTPGAEKSPVEMTVAEKMQFLTVEGAPLPIPCKVGDLGDGFSLGKGVAWDGYYAVMFYYRGKRIGNINVEGLNMEGVSKEDGLIDMSRGYEDGMITCFSLLSGVNFELLGVSSSSTKEELVALWGEPDLDKNSTMYEDRADDVEPGSGTHITFYWDEDGTVRGITVMYMGSY